MTVTEAPERYVTRQEMADIMSIGLRTLDYWVKDGMPSETFGKRRRYFLPSEAIRWAREQGEKATEQETV